MADIAKDRKSWPVLGFAQLHYTEKQKSCVSCGFTDSGSRNQTREPRVHMEN